MRCTIDPRFHRIVAAQMHHSTSLDTFGPGDSLGLDVEEALTKAADKPWEVFFQPLMKIPDKLLRYLGRYTHRTAMYPSRIQEVDEKEVCFIYRDYRQGGANKTLRLAGVKFLRRFLQHILPKGFRWVRFCGLFHGSALDDLQKAKEALKAKAEALLLALLQGLEVESQPTHRPPCPRCQSPMQQGSAIVPQ